MDIWTYYWTLLTENYRYSIWTYVFDNYIVFQPEDSYCHSVCL
jgi:hypothetical protein